MIDWAQVKQKITVAQETLERGFEPSKEQRNAILKQRAKILAREPEKEKNEQTIEVLEFLVVYERHAFETAYVREVYPLRELALLPGAPSFVLGITSVRGQILSVVDIKKFFDLPEKGLTDLNKIIILHSDGMEFGVLADAILGVHRVPVRELTETLPTLTGIRKEYLKGVTKERMVVLDAAKLLSDKRMVVREEV